MFIDRPTKLQKSLKGDFKLTYDDKIDYIWATKKTT